MTWRTALLLVWIQLGAVPPATVEKGAIEGIVLRLGTKEPVKDVRVGLLYPFGEIFDFNKPYVSVSTDAQGKFILKDVDPGRYRITLEANGYVRQEYGQRTFPGSGTVINLAPGQTVRDLSIELTPTGSVSGTVRDADQRPLTGVPVQLMKYSYDEYGDRQLRLAATTAEMTTQTDDRGDFRIYYVTPGRYYLNAGTPHGPPGSQDVRLGANELREMFSFLYFPGVPDPKFATTIDVQPGEAKVGMDMTLTRQKGVRVTGRIIDAVTGQPPEKPAVRLRYYDSVIGYDYWDLGTSSRGQATYKDGNFEFRNVLPGRFTVVVEMDEPGSRAVQLPNGPYIPSLKRIGYVPVEVGLTDIVGIVVTIAPGSSLNGRLRIEGNQDTSIERFSRIQLYPTMNGARPTIPGVPFPENGWVNSDGTFRIDNVMPGEYRLVADSIKYYVKQARFGTIDLLKEPLQFAGREQGTIEVLLSSNFASIEGTVRDRFAPAKGTRVVLVPDKSRHRIELFKATVSDQNGRFSISNVAPGDYRLYAWEAIEPYGWFDPEVLKRDEQSAQPVHLNESVRQTIDPRLIAAP